jgi:hypothetical protein
MGGRRSRYWCGPGFSRETKLAAVRRFTGQVERSNFFIGAARLTGRAISERKNARTETLRNTVAKNNYGKTSQQIYASEAAHSRPRQHPGAQVCQYATFTAVAP